MRPKLRVVVVPLQFIDLVFGFDVPVFGHTHVNTDPRTIGVFPVDSRVIDRLMGAINTDTSRPRSPPHFFSFLVTEFVEVTDTGQCLAYVADLVRHHPAASLEKAFAEHTKIVSIGRSQADAGDHDPLFVCRERYHQRGLTPEGGTHRKPLEPIGFRPNLQGLGAE